MRPFKKPRWHGLKLLGGALLLPLVVLMTLAATVASPTVAGAATSQPNLAPASQTNVNPLQYPCTVTSSTCNGVGTTNGFYGGAVDSFLYTGAYYCDSAESSHATNGCEAGTASTTPPPGVKTTGTATTPKTPTTQHKASGGSTQKYTDPLYIPVPLFTPTPGTTLNLQCPAGKPCIDHPHNIDLSAFAGVGNLPATATALDNAALPGHDHIVATTNNNQPEWWPVVVVPVTSQTGWNALTGPTGRSYAKMKQLQATATSGVLTTKPTNAYLFFQVMPGTVPQTAQTTSLSVPPSATNADGTTFTNLKTNCTMAAPGACEDVGLTHDWINGKNVDALYTQEYYCDTSVSSKTADGCEAGAGYNNLPPGVANKTATDPLYIPVPLFKPAPAYLQCLPGTPGAGGKTCIDHPNGIDLSRLATALGMPASALANAGLPGHDHILTTRNTNQPEWWPVVVVGVTNPASFHQIEQAKSLSEVRTLQATANSGVTADIPTNAFLWFNTLAGTGPVTPPPATATGGCSTTLAAGTVVGTVATADGGGYWEVSSSGAVAAFGDAKCFGSLSGIALNKPVVGIAADPNTGGYWLVASDGGIFAFNAPFEGSMGGQPLNQPIVGMAASASTGGYWMVASDGGIFAFNAPFHGSMGGKPLNKPVVGMSEDVTTGGYWMVASDGGIFAFTAPFHGSMGGKPLNEPMVSMAQDAATHGYWTVASDGGIFSFTAPFYGSAAA
ncbi:MAG: hypothetical protein ACRDYZ_09565 [Acidimicrobiales bacterium]